MSPTSKHLSDAEQLTLLDGEGPYLTGLLTHLAVCSQCRDRQMELAASSEAIRHLYRGDTGRVPTVSTAEARAQLERSLRRGVPVRSAIPRWSYAAVALLVAAVTLALVHRTHTTVEAAEIVPNLRLTPGATQTVALPELCGTLTEGDVQDQDPVVGPELQQAVLAEYGLTNAPAADYQIDYLINPQLGGTADLRNLWPEPYRAGSWNARAKDALEARLHQMVCTRQIDLATAQREIAANWIEAYKKYFDSKRPRS